MYCYNFSCLISQPLNVLFSAHTLPSPESNAVILWYSPHELASSLIPVWYISIFSN